MTLGAQAALASPTHRQVAAASEVRAAVVLVAPYAPGVAALHLGAAKKIEGVVALLHRLGFDVHLIDSSHPTLSFAGAVRDQACIVGDTPVRLWRPLSLPSRKLGKLVHVVLAPSFMRPLLRSAPVLVWVYNSYAFEARAALFLKRHAAAKLVLELEDLPTSRHRGLNPKPKLDQHFLPQLLAAADLVTYVNATLRDRAFSTTGRSMLFPSLLHQALVNTVGAARFVSTKRRLGYFGGLDTEKGADLLLSVLPELPAHWQLVVTGAGHLEREFRLAQRAHPQTMEFHGRVDHAHVMRLMHSCDAIVNPHTPIAAMNDGVFPFKVCEALATGALLLTTALPPIDIDLSRTVLQFDGTAQGLVGALMKAPSFYGLHAKDILRSREDICSLYGEEAVLKRLRVEFDTLLAA